MRKKKKEKLQKFTFIFEDVYISKKKGSNQEKKGILILLMKINKLVF